LQKLQESSEESYSEKLPKNPGNARKSQETRSFQNVSKLAWKIYIKGPLKVRHSYKKSSKKSPTKAHLKSSPRKLPNHPGNARKTDRKLQIFKDNLALLESSFKVINRSVRISKKSFMESSKISSSRKLPKNPGNAIKFTKKPPSSSKAIQKNR
jgi:hypothetical protein